MRLALLLIAGLLLLGALGAGCAAPPRDFDASLHSIVRPYRFSIAQWEAGALLSKLEQAFSGNSRSADGDVSMVADYFILEAEPGELEQQEAALSEEVERIIAWQIRETLVKQGIYNPVDDYVGIKVGFPPINFELEKPPHLLVVSPRDRIESTREILLHQEMNVEEMEDIEAAVDEMGVSSLVVGLGGFGGTYPTFVTSEASLRFTIAAATEEWLHQYLFFKPLGFLYVLDILGISPNYEIATMNETVASMISKEIGDLVMETYYPEQAAETPPEAGRSEFNREMREIRRAVDEYLARGEVGRAEEFMEERRQYLVSKGYYIRKLNQAYFAFYGTYADRPTSISPIGEELRELRSRSASLKDFLDTVSSMTSRQDLSESIK